jgi:hypothetical protein
LLNEQNRSSFVSFNVDEEFEFMAKKSKLAARAAELEAAVAGLFTGTPAAPAKKKRRKAKKAKVVKLAKTAKKTVKKVKKAAKKAVKKAKKKAKKR